MALKDFIAQYILTALWSETDGEEPLEDSVSPEDLAPQTLRVVQKECEAFYNTHNAKFERGDSHAGHDFWLTRNGHGAGFWDGDYTKAIGEELSKAAREVGEANWYIGDDGMVYQSGAEAE